MVVFTAADHPSVKKVNDSAGDGDATTTLATLKAQLG